ncbi:hypothetical protein MF672_042155 [Actinomadura sp. ATCC 31491]|uniref:Lipoprotein n=1 Tax=Actinomadura luzonensis TaxID=2805427 RepID=A0ABT0G6X2_9ACTN|nr:hypothetical protein [Actinomadura luzonensis]MCK2220362.1 hypothetical protein [Actinomadura luzonensis]
MNINMRQSRTPRRARFAALALTGAVTGVMFLPAVGLGVACASVGIPAVQAGGPPEPAPVHHVSKPRYVPREKPVLRSPRWQPPYIDVIVDNDNQSRNEKRRHKHESVKHEEPKPEPVKHVTPPEHDYDHDDDHDYDHDDDQDNGNWWWPGKWPGGWN